LFKSSSWWEKPLKVSNWRRSDRVIRSDRFQLGEGVQSSQLRVRVISEVKRIEVEESCHPVKILRVNRRPDFCVTFGA
jgi:hypothetical protein